MQSSHNGGTPTNGNSGKLPHLLMRAEGVSQNYIYEAASDVQIPPYMLTPLSGLKAVLTEQLRPGLFHGRPPTYSMTTNSSGIAFKYIPPGNYSVAVEQPDFDFSGFVSLENNVTTTLSLRILPVYNTVSKLTVLNQDTVMGLEESATLYLGVNGTFDFLPSSLYHLMGYGAVGNLTAAGGGDCTLLFCVVSLPLALVGTVNGTIAGTYRSIGGAWVVFTPTSPYQWVPQSGVLLVHYEATATVSYAND